jgi:uncharacterized repeat protein (TIGR03803 family)
MHQTLPGVRLGFILLLLPILIVCSAQAQTETVLYDFAGGNDGGVPRSNLIADSAGNLYGTTQYGGLGYGTVFELSPNGHGGWKESVLYSFTGGADGEYPLSSLLLDATGNLYGTTIDGGANFWGSVFELTRSGAGWNEMVLYNFCSQPSCSDGANPLSGLVRDAAGNLYGMTNNTSFPSVVYQLSPSTGGWIEKPIYSVDTNNDPGLTIDAAGNLFGTSGSTVFRLTPTTNGGWVHQVLHTFTGYPKDGGIPEGSPALDKYGNVYGATYEGGAQNYGIVFKLVRGRKGWTEHILYSFSGADGQYPYSGVVLDSAGNLFGTTSQGGSSGSGTVYSLIQSSSGSYLEKVLVNFDQTNGGFPTDSLIRDSTHRLYGTTQSGGSSGAGVVFRVSPSAPPF